MKSSLRITGLATGLLIVLAFAVAPRYTMLPESRLWVEGTSTVHDWTCEVSGFDGELEVADAAERVEAATVRVPVDAIDCDNGTMNRKAHDALGADDHPAISYTLTQATMAAPTTDGTFELATTGRLTIAGTTREVTMAVTGTRGPDGRLRLSGRLPLRMSDYGVDPPKAMLGALKTGDEVAIGFEVVAAR